MTNKVPNETAPPPSKKRNNNAQKRLTLAKSYDEEADEIMRWGDWYKRMGKQEEYMKHKQLADARYAHAKKLRGLTP